MKIFEWANYGRSYALIYLRGVSISKESSNFYNLRLVINYDFPNSMINYIHRVGRTGRAERDGKAITFYTDVDKPLLRSLGNMLNASGCEVPKWIF